MPEQELPEFRGPIYCRQFREQPVSRREAEDSSMVEVVRHVEQHIGPVGSVFHELGSDFVHIDIHVVPPTPGRDYLTLVTTGMSDWPMAVPDDSDYPCYAELLVNLPAGWPLYQEAFEEEDNYWPVRWLKLLARWPHERKHLAGCRTYGSQRQATNALCPADRALRDAAQISLFGVRVVHTIGGPA